MAKKSSRSKRSASRSTSSARKRGKIRLPDAFRIVPINVKARKRATGGRIAAAAPVDPCPNNCHQTDVWQIDGVTYAVCTCLDGSTCLVRISG